MEQLLNTYDLSAEQQNTAALLERLLGRAIANRYVDFCRLAAGAFALHVSRPVAAHALRRGCLPRNAGDHCQSQSSTA